VARSGSVGDAPWLPNWVPRGPGVAGHRGRAGSRRRPWCSVSAGGLE
jgi:hypothetical protein